MSEKYQRQKKLMQEKQTYLREHGYTGKITQVMLRGSWDEIRDIASGNVPNVSRETKRRSPRKRKELTSAEKVARSKRKYQRQKELMQKKKEYLIQVGYEENQITSKMLRQSWEKIEKRVYVSVYFGDRLNEADPKRYAIFYNDMTFDECMQDIHTTMNDRGMMGSNGYPGHVEVHIQRSKEDMEGMIQEMEERGYQVISAGNAYTKLEMARTIAFSVDMSTEDNRPYVLDGLLTAIHMGFPEMESDFMELKKYISYFHNF